MRIRAGRARWDALERAFLRGWVEPRADLRGRLAALYVLHRGCACGLRNVLMQQGAGTLHPGILPHSRMTNMRHGLRMML